MSAPVQGSLPIQVDRPSFGLFLDRDEYLLDPRALAEAQNVIVRDGALTNARLGWEPFVADVLGVRITGLFEFFDRIGQRVVVALTDNDAARYDPAGAGSLKYITPRYAVGSASAVGVTVSGLGGTLWATADPFREGEIAVQPGDQIAFGGAAIVSIAGPWYTIAAVVDDDTLTLEAPGVPAPTGIVAYTIRQRFGGNNLRPWHGDVFLDAQGTLAAPFSGGTRAAGDDLAYMTNGSAILSFKIADTSAARLDLGHSARALTRHKNRMIYGNLVVTGEAFPANIRASAVAEPENLATNGAVELSVTDEPQEIVGLQPLGDVLMSYNRTFDHQSGSLVMLQEVEEPIVFALRTAAPDVAVLSGRAIVDLGNVHEFLSVDAAYAFDGVQLTEHAGHVLRPIIRIADGSRLDEALALRDYENGDVNWVLPLSTDPVDEEGPVDAWVEHYLEPRTRGQPVPFGHRDLPATAAGYFTKTQALRFSDMTDDFNVSQLQWNSRLAGVGFPQLLIATHGGAILALGGRSDQDGTAYTSRARFGLAPAWPPARGILRGMVQRLTPFLSYDASDTGEVDIVLHGVETRGLDAQEILAITHPLNGSRREAPIRRVSRYVALELRATGALNTFLFRGYAALVVPTGRQ